MRKNKGPLSDRKLKDFVDKKIKAIYLSGDNDLEIVFDDEDHLTVGIVQEHDDAKLCLTSRSYKTVRVIE